MPYSAEHKKKSRDKILRSAVDHFTRYGFEKSSIDEIMADARLTRGAFYAHFSSKSELYQQAILSGAMMLDYLADKAANGSLADAAQMVETAIHEGFATNRLRPREFGGDMGTRAVAAEIADLIGETAPD